MSVFQLSTPFKPQGDQPEAIRKLVEGFQGGKKEQVLLGVTGSGKTFTLAHVIAALGKPALVMSHNKTLAAQLYSELKEFFPKNAVEYFVSYYDYYQPEAYIPHSDTYIEKDASINDDLDRLRLAATSSILSRPDTIIVSSVSCIYGLGSPEDWQGMLIQISKGQVIRRDDLLLALVKIQYDRADAELKRGQFRVRGSKIDLYPSYGEHPYRIFLERDTIQSIQVLDRESFAEVSELSALAVYPAKHFVTPSERMDAAMAAIQEELLQRIRELTEQGKDLQAKRLESRVKYDLEMLRELGYCSGVENYSRHLAGRAPGSTPYTLIDYFPKDFLLVIDESHQSLPQIRGMYHGDQSRKKTLVEHGFRLPSALDNRPLQFPEFESKVRQALYVSATPGPYEMERADAVVEQVIRPTGLMDPEIEIHPSEGQIEHLIEQIQLRAEKGERSLVTTVTKKMAEDLARYLQEAGTKAHYLHSEMDAFERVEILRDLRMQKYDAVIGVNLLREGLDLPEVSLVAILDADKQGFLRSEVSLIQIAGRAARHVSGKVLMYADQMTEAMRKAIDEMARRRELQGAFNKKHGITPQSIKKEIREGIEKWKKAEHFVAEVIHETEAGYEVKTRLARLKQKMEQAAKSLEFDLAARYRDEIRRIESEEGVQEKESILGGRGAKAASPSTFRTSKKFSSPKSRSKR